MLAGMAMTILASIVLLPSYARLAMARYHRDTLKSTNAQARSMVAANERLITDVQTNPRINERLARDHLGLQRDGGMIIVDSRYPDVEPLSVKPAFQYEPAKPSAWVLDTAARLEKPLTRGTLFVLAMLAIGAGVWFFAPPREGEPADDLG